jgi:hypothetical protein
MKLVNKISAAKVLGNVLEIVKQMTVGQTLLAYAVVAKATGYEQGISALGEWIRFTGEIQATNYFKEGEIYRGPRAHVPKVLEAVIVADLAANTVDGSTTKDGKGVTSSKLKNVIEFAYRVSITRLADKEDGGVNYEYTTEPVTEMKESDNLAHLTKLLGDPAQHFTKLDAPTPVAAKAVKGKAAAK